MKNCKFEFLDFLVKKYKLNQKEVSELKNIMIKNDISEDKLMRLLEEQNKEDK